MSGDLCICVRGLRVQSSTSPHATRFLCRYAACTLPTHLVVPALTSSSSPSYPLFLLYLFDLHATRRRRPMSLCSLLCLERPVKVLCAILARLVDDYPLRVADTKARTAERGVVRTSATGT